MFGRDPVLPLNTLLEPKIRYMGNDINIISLETMKNLYEVAAISNWPEKKEIPKNNHLLQDYKQETQF